MQQRQYAISFLNHDSQRTDLLNRFSLELMRSNAHCRYFQDLLFSVTGIAIQVKNNFAYDINFIQRVYETNEIHRKAICELDKISITPNLKSQILLEIQSCKTYLDNTGYRHLSMAACAA